MWKKRGAPWIGLLLVALFFFSGCAGLGKPVEEPQVTLVDLQLLEMKPLEAVFQIQLRVMNPNDFSFALRGVNCDLKIDDKYFATGVGSEAREIPAFGTGVVPVTVYASTLNMFSSVLQMVQGLHHQQQGELQALRYELVGKLRIGGRLNQTVPFHSKGELSLNAQGL